MTKPSDFSPSQEIEARHSRDARSLSRRLWALRILGLILLVLSWSIVGAPQFGSSRFFVTTAVFASMGVAAFTAAITARRLAVNLEKKLRLRLLVHNTELESMAMRDDLTRLFNRRYLLDRLERELETAKISGQPLALSMIDLASLKSINDAYGYRVGDQVLANFGQLLLDYSRATDIPARIGSDEFAILLPDTTKRGACNMVDRLTHALANTNLLEDNDTPLPISASFGISGYPWGADTVDNIVQQADAALSANKQAHQTCPDEPADGIPAAFRQSIDDILDPEAPQ